MLTIFFSASGCHRVFLYLFIENNDILCIRRFFVLKVGESSYDSDRFETQEHTISFTSDEEDVYHILSPLSHEQYKEELSHLSSLENPALAEKTARTHHTSIVITNSSSNDSGSSVKNFIPKTCIVLPAVERIRKQSRPTSLNIHSASRPTNRPGINEWKSKDRITFRDTERRSSLVSHLSGSSSRLNFR